MADLMGSALAGQWGRRLWRMLVELEDGLAVLEGIERKAKRWRRPGNQEWHEYPPGGYTEGEHAREASCWGGGDSPLPRHEDDPGFEWHPGQAVMLDPLREFLTDIQAAERRLREDGLCGGAEESERDHFHVVLAGHVSNGINVLGEVVVYDQYIHRRVRSPCFGLDPKLASLLL